MPTDPIYTLLYNTAADKSSVFYCPFEIFPCVVKRYDPFSFTKEEKTEIKAGIKAGLEGLAGQIPGLLSIQVHTKGLPSSNADLMLDSCFADAASLKGYSVHPAHVAVADGKVRPNVKCRVCMDYEVTEA